ncbi:MAG: hypothetical protein GY856_25415 [bacterium]|nr:hypothetical protein [bacterium]
MLILSCMHEVAVAQETFRGAGVVGGHCYGLDPCTVVLDGDITVDSTVEDTVGFRVLGTVPANGDTGISRSSNVSFVFDRDIAPGPALGDAVFREVNGPDVPFNPFFPSRGDCLGLSPTVDLEEGIEHEVILPAGAVEDLAGEPLPNEYHLRFTTGVFGAPRIFVSAYPRAIAEDEETTVHVWFDRPQPYPRDVSLNSGGQLVHPGQVTIPADEVIYELRVSGADTANDIIAPLQVSEPGSGTASANIVVGDIDPEGDDPYQFVDVTFLDDDDHDGVFEAGEDAYFFVRVRNSGNYAINNPRLRISAVNISSPSLLKSWEESYDVAYLVPGEVDGADIELRSDSHLPSGLYYLRIEGDSDNGGTFVAYCVVEIINPELPAFILTSRPRGGRIYYVSPGAVLTVEYSAYNYIDGGHPALPPVEITVVDSTGESVFSQRTYADIRGEFFTQDRLELTFAVPYEPGTYTIEGTINPPPDPIPEDSSADNDASPYTLIVNRPPVFDPVPAAMTVNTCDDFALELAASDPDGDYPLTFQLIQAPVGAALEATSPTTARLTWTPTAAQGPTDERFELEVDDGNGGNDTVDFNVEVTRKEDLAITKTTPAPTAVPGGDISFTVTVTHEGSCGTPGRVVDVFEPHLHDITWSCTASDGSSCTAGGSGEIRDLGLSLAKDGTATYEIAATVADHARGAVMNTATVSTVIPVTDPVPDNDSATATVALLDLDFGDAPDSSLGSGWSYPIRLADDGARHGMTGLRLGVAGDGEIDGQPSLRATADDQNGGDDEDGVGFLSSFGRCGGAQLEVSLTSTGRLDAWFDWNGDSVWAADEKTFDSLVLSAGTHALTVSVPCTAADRSFARFRVSTAGGLLPTGLAMDGEVEDYQIDSVALTPFFSDGFESGDVSAWSLSVGLAARPLSFAGGERRWDRRPFSGSGEGHPENRPPLIVTFCLPVPEPLFRKDDENHS